jgi:hypothetical protein
MDNLVFWFLCRNVTVEYNGLRVQGRLVSIQESSCGRDHRPMVLVLQDKQGQWFLVRGWDKISLEAS